MPAEAWLGKRMQKRDPWLRLDSTTMSPPCWRTVGAVGGNHPAFPVVNGDEIGNFVEIADPALHFPGEFADDGRDLVEYLLDGEESFRFNLLDIAAPDLAGDVP